MDLGQKTGVEKGLGGVERGNLFADMYERRIKRNDCTYNKILNIYWTTWYSAVKLFS